MHTLDRIAETYQNNNKVLYKVSNDVDITLKTECEEIYGTFKDNSCTNYAFNESTTTLKSITFPSGSHLKTIGDCAFYQCSLLSAVDFSNCAFLTNIKQYAFSGCTSLSNIVLPSSLTSLSEYCFQRCSIISIIIPNEVTALYNSCLRNCFQLETVTIYPESKLQIMESFAFYATNLKTLFIPRYVSNFKSSILEWSKTLESITCDELNEYFTSDGGILYSKNKDTLVLYPANYGRSFTIPTFVTSIAQAAFDTAQIDSVTFNPNVNTIGNWAFVGSSIKQVIIPNTITKIGSGAFQRCTLLSSVTLEQGIKSIPDSCFKLCNISSITFPDSLTSIGASAFEGCTNLKSVVLPPNITSLGGNCFPRDSTHIEFAEGSQLSLDDQMIVYNPDKSKLILCLNKSSSYTIPSSVTSISKGAFQSISDLVSITFESGSKLKTINENSFQDCDKLSDFELPSTVTTIKSNAFSGCSSLRSITFGSTISVIDSFSFSDCTSLNKVIFVSCPNVTLGESAFSGCTNLVYLTLSNNVTRIEKNCFRDCTSLTNIVFPTSVESIGIYAFSNSGLETVTIPDGSRMTTITSSSFRQCTKLRSINIPNTISGLEESCFESTSLTTFKVPLQAVFISHYAFKDCVSLSQFTIPESCSLSSLGNLIFDGCTSLSIIECPSSQYFEVDNGALYNKGRSILYCFPPASSIKFFSLPQNIRTISSSAFISCKNIISIAIPDNSVETIGQYAFSNCASLNYINIPACVKSIDAHAFLGCNNLRCGINIETKNKTFIRSLIDTCDLNPVSIKACAFISCKQVFYQSTFSLKSFINVFILM